MTGPHSVPTGFNSNYRGWCNQESICSLDISSGDLDMVGSADGFLSCADDESLFKVDASAWCLFESKVSMVPSYIW